MSRKAILAILLGLAVSAAAQQNLTRWVNPFIGTGGHGHTFPGATLPFGMVQLSPDTRLEGWDGCSGYHYSDSTVYGFSHTHLSGTGCSDYGDILLMPRIGEVVWQNGYGQPADSGYGSPFSHANEKALPGYYAVHLDDSGIVAELTATTRTGLHRYTFPAGEGHVLIDLAHRDLVLAAGLEVVGPNEIAGFRRSSAWAQDQHVYFVARFSRPFQSVQFNQNGTVLPSSAPLTGKNLKAAVQFDTEAGEMILVKVGISAVSIEGARRNLDAEQPGFDFEGIKAKAQAAWEKTLSKIVVEGGTDAEKTAFYTALYHSCIAPNCYQDVDGQYRGRDLNVHTAKDFDYYTVFSLWDTFRATHPLFTLIEQKRTVDFIQTFLAQYAQGGRLPVWELGANETDCMIGYHSIPVIVDAYMKGIRGFDRRLALKAMRASAERDADGIKEYREHGYIPGDLEPESVSKTLEYAYDDWCIAVMAREMGEESIYRTYIDRAQYYKNLYDYDSGFMRAKLNGQWQTPFNPAEVNFHFTEANSWQYSFFAPQDITGMTAMLGGADHLAARLDSLFTVSSETAGRHQADITGLIGQYAHGNEPSHHMAYLYNYAGQPWKTQAMVRRIMDTMYSDQPDGLSGNEDCGQMSSWLVLSALGLYPVTPGQPQYAVGTPLFDKATLTFENGKRFVITADTPSSETPYIQSLTLNGQSRDLSYITHADMIQGGRLHFALGAAPNEKWAATPQSANPTGIIHEPLTLAPVVTSGATTFYDAQTITLKAMPMHTIRYTLDGSMPGFRSARYTNGISMEKSTTVKAVSISPKGAMSHIMTAEFKKIPQRRSIAYAIACSPQYTAGGDKALIDFIRGGNDFRTGRWQGFWGTGFDATVDLGAVQPVKRIAAGFLQNVKSWVWMPAEIVFSISTDGETFEPVKRGSLHLAEDAYGAIVKEFAATLQNKRARYVRVTAQDGGAIPAWHPGAGDKRWIFIDEIVIE